MTPNAIKCQLTQFFMHSGQLTLFFLCTAGVGNVRAVIIGMGSDVSVKIADEVKPPFIKRVDMVKGKDMFK